MLAKLLTWIKWSVIVPILKVLPNGEALVNNLHLPRFIHKSISAMPYPIGNRVARSSESANNVSIGFNNSGVVRNCLTSMIEILGIEVAKDWYKGMLEKHPECELALKWGWAHAYWNIDPSHSVELSEEAYKLDPRPQYARALSIKMQQAGEITRPLGLEEQIARDTGDIKTRDFLKARERLLENGFELPEREMRSVFAPKEKSVLYL
ncbi:MAG: hypothetical protein MJA83_03015, partial [Gammaproteobacteria bacterium]|nr:hypothetical protein [Gammaproteobacteria bacterium]